MKESQVTVEANPPRIAPLASGADRPFWWVMISAYSPRTDYLAQALENVLAQDPSPDRMHIEVVDVVHPRWMSSR